jgi:hypothetical protein
MNRTQWVVVGLLVLVLVFGITFAMNYLGGSQTAQHLGPETQSLDLTFLSAVDAPAAAPPTASAKTQPWVSFYGVEGEVHKSNYRDFWFCNANDREVKVGLFGKGCQCSSVELFLAPLEPASQHPGALGLVAAAGTGPQAPLSAATGAVLPLRGMSNRPKVKSWELLHRTESVRVPAGAVGWLRLAWKTEKPGPQRLSATIWVDDPSTGKTTTLSTRVVTYEAFRVVAVGARDRSLDTLALGALTDDDLKKEVKAYIYCWSSTRPSFRLQAKRSRGGADDADPFEVEAPVPLTAEEMAALDRDNNPEHSTTQVPHELRGPVRCGYKVPVILRHVAKDGMRPFDLGPFQRGVSLTCPDVPGDPKVVMVTGRVRGIVDIGYDDARGEINFRTFSQQDGARETLSLQSDVPNLKLRFDEKRTPSFLTARLDGPTRSGESRQSWTLKAEAKKGAARGPFPRRGDPLYEDSAIYLEALEPGKLPRPIRIPVHGTAKEG